MRVTFACITLTIDFKTKEEAERYKRDNWGKGWRFGEIGQFSNEPDGNGNMWTMEVKRPYKDYNMGC